MPTFSCCDKDSLYHIIDDKWMEMNDKCKAMKPWQLKCYKRVIYEKIEFVTINMFFRYNKKYDWLWLQKY